MPSRPALPTWSERSGDEFQPDRNVSSEGSVSERGGGHQDLGIDGQGEGRRPEVDQATEPRVSGEGQHVGGRVRVPGQSAVAERGMPAPHGQSSSVEIEMAARILILGLDRETGPVFRLRQPGRRSVAAEPERRLLPGPGERHPAPVPASFGVPGAQPGGVLQQFLGQIFDLLQAEFVTLVDVRPAGQRQLEQDGRPGPPAAELRRRCHRASPDRRCPRCRGRGRPG